MKFLTLLVCLISVSFYSKGQDYSVEATFTLKEPRLLIFNEDNKPLHDSLVITFNLSNLVNQKDSIKIAGLVSYTEAGNRFYILRLINPAKMYSYKKDLTKKSIEYYKFDNDLTWIIESIKFEYLISILNFEDKENTKLKTLINSSKATYSGINISKLRNNIENNLDEFKEFLY